MTTKDKAPRKSTTKAERLADLEDILDLKAQGWSDQQIRKSKGLDQKAYDSRLKLLRSSNELKLQALNFLVETVLRLRWLRMEAFNQYVALKNRGAVNAYTGMMKRMIEIDVAIPKVCEQLDWRPDDLERFVKKGQVSAQTSFGTEEEMLAEFRRLTGARV